MRTATFGRYLILLMLWIGATVGIAFLVARAATHESAADLTAPQPVIGTSQRATVSLAATMIAPVVGADGTVVQGPDGFLLEAPVSTDDLAYRLLDAPVGVKALIKGGPAGFDCAWAGLGQPGDLPAPVATPVAFTFSLLAGGDQAPANSSAASSSGSGSGPNVVMRCAIPADVRVIAGLRGTMVLQMAKPVTAQALPVSAVLGTSGQGQVIVMHDDGTTEVRTVQLGVSDIYNVQITGGLEPTDKVMLNPVQEDFSEAGA
ncbi:MAG: hypothetical protein QM589_17745 [Thermomicrobiales bacterium]